MLARIPVLAEENHILTLQIYAEADDGVFRRTGDRSFRWFDRYLAGCDDQCGILQSARYERDEHAWLSPTVRVPAARPVSLYQFLRSEIGERRFPVFIPSPGPGRVIRLAAHQLRISGASRPILVKLERAYCEAVRLRMPVEGAVDEPPLPVEPAAGVRKIRYAFDRKRAALVPNVVSLAELTSARPRHIDLSYEPEPRPRVKR